MEITNLSEHVVKIRQHVKQSFSELRKIGFVSRTNFSCCMSCAVAELCDIAEKPRRNRAVYWHRQDEEHFRKTGVLYIRFCYLPAKGIEGDTVRMTAQIGEQVAAALRKAGLDIEWNGDPRTSIVITGVSIPSETTKDVNDAETM